MKNKFSSLLACLLFGQGNFNFLIYSGLIFERETSPDSRAQNQLTSKVSTQPELDQEVISY